MMAVEARKAKKERKKKYTFITINIDQADLIDVRLEFEDYSILGNITSTRNSYYE